MRLKIKMLALAASFVLATGAYAQMSDSTFFVTPGPGGPMQTRTAVSLNVETDTAPVKGAPFCANVSTEHTQHLADGNRIHTSESSMLCRDSEGRTRREAGLNLLGAAPQSSAPKLITIVDPVAGVRYLLDTGSKTAQKMTFSAEEAGAEPAPGKGERVFVMQHPGGGVANVIYKTMVKKSGGDSSDSDSHTESLGDQTIEGIHVTGTRVTTTIAAGKMGNDKPITVTSERWYSPELKEVVMTKHNDPWAGELITEFKNVTTAEPDASLFTLPADYKVVMEDKEGPIRIKIQGPGDPSL